jgi:hypothetical protein
MRKSITFRLTKFIGPLLMLGLAACTMPLAAPLEPVPLGAAGPQTWIDAPLDEMHLPLAPYEVVFHASDAGAISQMELQINDQPAELPAPSGSGENLATVKYVWVPQAPGVYVLRARSQGDDGPWSDEDQVTVYIGDDIVTPTPLTITPTPLTITPTRVGPTFTPTPLPGGALSFSPRISGQEFYYGGCSPASIDFEVTVAGADVDSVVLFFKLNDQDGSGTSGWQAHNSMSRLGSGVYRIKVRADQVGGHEEFQAAYVSYQFVATFRNAVVGRSESRTDVVMGRCGTAPQFLQPISPLIPPQIIIVPGITPEIIK